MNSKLKSNLFLIFTAMIWGFAFVAQQESASTIGGISFNAVRYIIGAVSLVPVILIFERSTLSKADALSYLKYGALCGFILCVASNFQQYGIILMNSAGKSGFLTGLYTVLVPIISFVFLKKKSSANIWVGAGLAVVGLFLLCMPTGKSDVSPQQELLGIVLTLIGTVFWALHILSIDRFAATLKPITFSLTQFLFCSIFSFIGAGLFEIESVPSLMLQIKATALPLLYGGVMSVGIAYTCQVIGQRGANPTAAAIIMSTESVFSAVGEALFYGLIVNQPDYSGLSATELLGCAIMFGGIVVSQISFASFKRLFVCKKSG